MSRFCSKVVSFATIILLPIFFITFGCYYIKNVKIALNDTKELQGIDPSKRFDSLGAVCTIKSVHLKSSTKSKSKWVHCEDSISYDFTVNDDKQIYSSTTGTIERNRIVGTLRKYPDMCTKEDLDAYDGVYLNEARTKPFICESGECQVGDLVECWQPSSDIMCSNIDDECKAEFSWANCGNYQCKKLTDPMLDYNEALHDAQWRYDTGRKVLSIFAVVWAISSLLWFLGLWRYVMTKVPTMEQAIKSGKTQMVHRCLIMRRKAAYMPLSTSQTLPIHMAAQRGLSQVVKILLEAYPDGASSIDHYGRVPLHYSARNGSIECLKLLLDAYPEGVHVANRNGILPYMDALRYYNSDIVQILLYKDKYSVLFHAYVER